MQEKKYELSFLIDNISKMRSEDIDKYIKEIDWGKVSPDEMADFIKHVTGINSKVKND